MRRFDVAIIGGGIVGIAHAMVASGQGRSVLLIERSDRPRAASIRNFGMIWPIGQPSGARLDRAMRGRSRWLRAAREAGFWAAEVGSLHVAHHADELAVLEEFVGGAGGRERDVTLMDPDAAKARCPALRREGLCGAMWSPTELCVDPREAVWKLMDHLERTPGVVVRRGTTVIAAEGGRVQAITGEAWQADEVLICCGSEFALLYPALFQRAPLQKCKLQMMRTEAQAGGWRLGPHVAGGLTLRHYEAFRSCPTQAALRERVARERPEFDHFGIHVMASQNGLGEVVLGDSHEYGMEFLPGLRGDIDAHILRYLREWLEVPDLHIAHRWSGVYGKRTDGAADFVRRIDTQTRVVTGLGGGGMTLSFGLAEEVLGEAPPAWSEREHS